MVRFPENRTRVLRGEKPRVSAMLPLVISEINSDEKTKQTISSRSHVAGGRRAFLPPRLAALYGVSAVAGRPLRARTCTVLFIRCAHVRPWAAEETPTPAGPLTACPTSLIRFIIVGRPRAYVITTLMLLSCVHHNIIVTIVITTAARWRLNIGGGNVVRLITQRWRPTRPNRTCPYIRWAWRYSCCGDVSYALSNKQYVQTRRVCI